MLKLHIKSDSESFKEPQDRLSRLLKTLYNIPYWQPILNSSNIVSDNIDSTNSYQCLALLPVTTKSTYNKNFPDKITSSNNKSTWQFLSSAGTNDRMTVVTDFVKRDYLRAAEHLTIKLSQGQPFGRCTVDIPPSACNVVCGLADEGPEPLIHYLLWIIKVKRTLNRAILSDIRGRVERQIFLKRKTLMPIESNDWAHICIQLDTYLEQISTEKIKVIRGYPHFLYWLAKRAVQKDLSFPHVEVLIPYGGLAGEALVSFICSVFKADFVNVYGTGEVGSIGISNKNSHELNVYRSVVHVEVVDDEGNTVKNGQHGNILVTDLTNQAMPIIRYSIGDMGVISSNESEPNTLIVLGRKVESMLLASGKTVYARQVQNLFFARDEIINFKVERLTAKMFKIQIVLYKPSELIGFAEELQTIFELSKPPKLHLVEFICPESSGKYIAVKDSYTKRTSH
ncbi:hypothetical protein [Paraglaciecola sp.]|uniref:hypothetical protein n=1 Tax=Paraglaciecola sp. TaxID=1920173 RepID=UPI003EF37470